MRDPLPIGCKASGIIVFWTLIDHGEEYHDERSQVYVRPFETSLFPGFTRSIAGLTSYVRLIDYADFRHLYPVEFRAGMGVETGSYDRINRS